MTYTIGIIIGITAILALYWVFIGQRKHNEMFKPKKRDLKAIIFDMDGVLIDSKDAWFKVFNHTREKFKLQGITMEEFDKKVWGGSVEADSKKYFKARSADEIAKIYVETFSKFIKNTKLMPHTKEVLQKIKEKNLKIGLVTNTFKEPTSKVLKHHKIIDYFDAIVSGDEVEHDKPYPDEIIEVCKRLGIEPEDAILVGDTKFDIGAGRSAGSFVVGYNIMADMKISSLNDLLHLI